MVEFNTTSLKNKKHKKQQNTIQQNMAQKKGRMWEFVISTVAKLMKIRYKPEMYHVELHSNDDQEPMASVVCFSFFSGRLKSQQALNVSHTSWVINVVELKHITTKSTNESRVHVRKPNADWPI